jgi:hypothetical protein
LYLGISSEGQNRSHSYGPVSVEFSAHLDHVSVTIVQASVQFDGAGTIVGKVVPFELAAELGSALGLAEPVAVPEGPPVVVVS